MNAFILLEAFRKKHADIPELQRPDRYGQLDFTTELIRQLADLNVHADVPLVSKKRVFTTHSCYDQGKIFIFLMLQSQRETERAKNKCQMYGL